MKRFLIWLVLASTATGACANPPEESKIAPAPPGGKVLVVGIGGVDWQDVDSADSSTLDELIRTGAAANVAVRVANNRGQGFATLGAAEKADVPPSAAWAFNRDEVVENGPADALFARRGGDSRAGEIVVPAIEVLTEANSDRAFDAPLGLLAEKLAKDGRQTAVIGNADLSLGDLTDRLPTEKQISRAPISADPGIHREAALAAMGTEGTVALGEVSRILLEQDRDAPFGVATSVDAVTDSFRDIAQRADFVVVDAGDTYRADLYSLGLPEHRRAKLREEGVVRAGVLIDALLDEVEPESTLLVILASVTPGGPEARGELRPAIISGPQIATGVLTSTSTRRVGIVTMPDISALIAHHLGLTEGSFKSGRLPSVVAAEAPIALLSDQNLLATTEDRVRVPVSVTAVIAQLLIYLGIIIWLRLRPLQRPGVFLLMSALAFPLASFVSRTPIWKAGHLAAAGAIAATTLILGLAGTLAFRRWGMFQSVAWLLGATVAFFFVDLLNGSRAQIDSILGFTSVAAGRFYGLGNLGFSVFAASSLLLAGMIATYKASAMSNRWRLTPRLLSVFLAIATVVFIGHPSLGSDVGGTLAFGPAIGVLIYGLYRKGISRRGAILIVVGVALLLFIFLGLDALRPADQRTHLGGFFASVVSDPSTLWLFVQRKGSLAIRLAFTNGWGATLVVAAVIITMLQYRQRDLWRSILREKPALKVGLKAFAVAAIVGSLVNDSGLAVAGVMVSIGIPWSLLIVFGSERASSPETATT